MIEVGLNDGKCGSPVVDAFHSIPRAGREAIPRVEGNVDRDDVVPEPGQSMREPAISGSQVEHRQRSSPVSAADLQASDQSLIARRSCPPDARVRVVALDVWQRLVIGITPGPPPL